MGLLPHLDEYSSQKSPPSRWTSLHRRFPGSYPVFFLQLSPFSFCTSALFSTSRKLHFLGPDGICFTSDMNANFSDSVLPLYNLNLHLFFEKLLNDARFYFGSKLCTNFPFPDNLNV